MFSRGVKALLAPVIVLLGAWLLFELSRPDVLLVGNITVDLVDGTTPTGGAVSYAYVVAKALGATACVVTVAGPEADLDIFDGARLYLVPANETLTFEHTYTWWGHSRRLRVTANPSITLSKLHVPWRCRLARVVLLGPLTLHDVDAASFGQHTGFWDALLNRRQLVGLMAQGFQRELGPDGEVLPLPSPSRQLMAGLHKRVQLFLSDVETDTWSTQDLDQVVSGASEVVITQGEKGATLLVQRDDTDSSSSSSTSGGAAKTSRGFQQWSIPAVKVTKAVDTNGAGDTFATMYMMAAMRGDPQPGRTASWAASRAVLQPQTCKPRCAPALITQPGGVRPITATERLLLAAAPLLRHLASVASGPARQLAALVPQADWLQAAVEQVEQFAVSRSLGRFSSSGVGFAGAVSLAGVGTIGHLNAAGLAAAGPTAVSGGVAAAATAAHHSPGAGVEQH